MQRFISFFIIICILSVFFVGCEDNNADAETTPVADTTTVVPNTTTVAPETTSVPDTTVLDTTASVTTVPVTTQPVTSETTSPVTTESEVVTEAVYADDGATVLLEKQFDLSEGEIQ